MGTQGMIIANRNNRSMQKSTTKFTRSNGKTTFPSGNTVSEADRAATKRLKSFNATYTLIVWLLTLAACGLITYLCTLYIR